MHELFTQIIHQFGQTTWLEWLGTCTGFLCVYLAAKQHILNWPISIISVLAYAILFYETKLYGDSFLQMYFLFTAIYGWYYWSKRKNDATAKPLVSLSSKQFYWVLTAIALFTLLIGSFLHQVTDSDVPFIDGFCTSVSFVAQFLMTRKIVQNWILWVFVDICYIPLYMHKDLYLTAILYLAFAIIAWNGYRDWNKTYLASNNS